MSTSTIRTPNNLDVLMHCFVTAEPHPRRDAPAVIEAFRYLRDEGLISIKHGEQPRVTEKGNFYIEHLLAQPFPVESYQIPQVTP